MTFILSRVRQWSKDRGVEKVAGPMKPSPNDECGLLEEGFDPSPCFMVLR